MKRAPYAIHMSCDHTGHPCLREVRRAPRIVVPSAKPIEDHRRLTVMTTLHYCDEHRWHFAPAQYWTDRQKARLEATARDAWLLPWKPDFEASYIEFVLVTIPEYQAFLWEIGRRLNAA